MCILSKDPYFSQGLSSILSEKTKKMLDLTDAVLLDDGQFFFYILDKNILNAALKDKSLSNLISLFFEFNQFTYERRCSVKDISFAVNNRPVRPLRFSAKRLSTRETEIISYLFYGKTAEEIASVCHINIKTVSSLKLNAFHKMSIKNTAMLIRAMTGWLEIIIFYLKKADW